MKFIVERVVWKKLNCFKICLNEIEWDLKGFGIRVCYYVWCFLVDSLIECCYIDNL